MTVQPHPRLQYVTPDTVAECWNVGEDLYVALWKTVGAYDDAYRANIEDIGPADVVGLNNVTDFWNQFTDEQKAELNRAAQQEEDFWK